MMKITNLNEIAKMHSPALKAHIEQKVQNWIEEYQIADLDEIGCFVILDADENAQFPEDEMEFVEELVLKNETYLHGVRILGDCYGEDIYLNILKGEKAMFEPNKPRYLTRGVDAEIPVEIQAFLWSAIDHMPEEKDYLQVFNLSGANGLQIIRHTAEQPEFGITYILPMVETIVTAKIYVIDSVEYCTMLLAEEY